MRSMSTFFVEVVTTGNMHFKHPQLPHKITNRHHPIPIRNGLIGDEADAFLGTLNQMLKQHKYVSFSHCVIGKSELIEVFSC